MNPAVTITISVGADGSASVEQGIGTSTAPPEPMALETLEVASSVESPAPLEPAALAAAQGTTIAEASAEPPGPMSIEQLVAGVSTAAPAPVAVGALEAVGGPPGPLSLAELGISTPDVPSPDDGGENSPQTPRKRSAARKK